MSHTSTRPRNQEESHYLGGHTEAACAGPPQRKEALDCLQEWGFPPLRGASGCLQQVVHHQVDMLLFNSM